jgi:preprotein translocase SecF subunit
MVAIFGGIILVFIIGIDYGIDFTGGYEKTIKMAQPISAEQLRDFLVKSDINVDEIKSFGQEDQALIRIKDTVNFNQKLSDGVKANLPGNNIEVIKEDTISAKVGQEMRFNAFLAVFLSLIAILIYIAFRFEFIYGVGAVIAMIHDVIFTFSVIVIVQKLGWLNLEVNMSILAAMLTVVGYSINDTVIIFDRIRENKTKHKGMHFLKLVNLSINETLSRTVNTVLTVVLVLLAMVILSGPVLQGFAFTMLIGILIGTYSSIYIASAIVIYYLEKKGKIKAEEEPTKNSLATSKA